MFIPDPIFFHPGSRIQGHNDPGSRIQIRIKEFLTEKIVSKLSEIWSGMFIPDPGSGSWIYTHPGSRGQKGIGSQIPDPDPHPLVWVQVSIGHPC